MMGVVPCSCLPFTEVLWVRPGAVLLLRHWPVAAGVAGPADVLHLPLLLHGLTDACHVASKLRVGAHCVWRERERGWGGKRRKRRINATVSF